MKKENKIWITSDHHFNHYNIIRYCKRPFGSVKEMNETMIKKWNKKVKPIDLVIHLGDFAFKRSAGDFRKRLNGTILLIKGNHDFRINKDDGFIIIEGIIQIGNLLLTHRHLLPENIPKGFYNVHGHIHQKDSFNGINVSVEKTDYEPIELNELIKNIKKNEI